jgi:hypothetical protein
MIKSSFILFFTCFLIYLPFSREPDFIDSETAPATIVAQGDSIVAVYSEFGKSYSLRLQKKEYQNKIGQKTEVIYELSHPEKAVINQIWGYWLIGNELAWSFGIFVLLLGIAFATTHHPHPVALEQQLNYKEEIKSKYQ